MYGQRMLCDIVVDSATSCLELSIGRVARGDEMRLTIEIEREPTTKDWLNSLSLYQRTIL